MHLVNLHFRPTLESRASIYNVVMSQQNNPEEQFERGLALEEARPEVTRPPLYQVLILNDDFTPMDLR
jgi:ATP-dependent Clp protease adapter protein ClpS